MNKDSLIVQGSIPKEDIYGCALLLKYFSSRIGYIIFVDESKLHIANMYLYILALK